MFKELQEGGRDLLGLIFFSNQNSYILNNEKYFSL